MLSAIRLFKAVPVSGVLIDQNYSPAPELETSTIPSGFIFAPDVVKHYQGDLKRLAEQVNATYGRNAEQLNQTFHKSFATVRDTPMATLVAQQIVHYLTTYGAEHYGIFKQENVYIPGEVLELPELKDGLPLVVIRGWLKSTLKAELLKFLSLGVALSQQTIEDVLDVADYVGLSEEDIMGVKNKEVKASLFTYLKLVPKDPQEFLRYVVFMATEQALLIKSPGVIAKIKGRQNIDVSRAFARYEALYGLEPLAAVFYRFKPIFLAFRTTTGLRRIVNRIRRLAVKHHKPMKEDLLNSVTQRIAKGEHPSRGEWDAALFNANVFRKIRLAYALQFRTTDAESILYRIRNGKSFAKEFSFEHKGRAAVVRDIVLNDIARTMRPAVYGKKIYIPKGLVYGLPATEKQFTGNLPSGTHVVVEDNLVAGVHWENKGTDFDYYGRVDLDLSVSNASGKIGWDGSYRSGGNDVLFSGDITDAPAPLGATEVFHFGAGARGSWLMELNYYHFSEGDECPFKIVVGHDTQRNIKSNYTIDPNKIVALANSNIDTRQKALGLIVADDESTRFYFAETNFKNSFSSRYTQASEWAREYLLNYYTNAISLNGLLVQAGAELVDSPEGADINLSPEVVDKSTILSLLAPATQEEATPSPEEALV